MWETRFWQNAETNSGSGSTLAYTENIRKELPKVFEKYGIKTILDAPCGDRHWISHMQANVQYISGDIAPTGETVLDIREELPKADAWLCRACLFHMPFCDIHRALLNRSKFRYFIASTHDNEVNDDRVEGDFKLLNLRKPPFNLPEPMELIKDWIEGFPVLYLGVWCTSSA